MNSCTAILPIIVLLCSSGPNPGSTYATPENHRWCKRSAVGVRARLAAQRSLGGGVGSVAATIGRRPANDERSRNEEADRRDRGAGRLRTRSVRRVVAFREGLPEQGAA